MFFCIEWLFVRENSIITQVEICIKSYLCCLYICFVMCLLFADKHDDPMFLDSKVRGNSRGRVGDISWDLGDVVHLLDENTTTVCFKYYRASTKEVLASSPHIVVKKAASDDHASYFPANVFLLI